MFFNYKRKEIMNTISIENLTARKEHRCNWCSQPIQKGENYRKGVYVDGGDLYAFKNHHFCEKVTNLLNMWENTDAYSEGLTENDFHESIHEEYRELTKDKQGTDFKFPSFREQYLYVLDFYNIDHTFSEPKPTVL